MKHFLKGSEISTRSFLNKELRRRIFESHLREGELGENLILEAKAGYPYGLCPPCPRYTTREINPFSYTGTTRSRESKSEYEELRNSARDIKNEINNSDHRCI